MPPAAYAAAIWLVICMARDSSEALTTFGKNNPSNPAPIKPTPPPGRECSREIDCAGIAGTSCVRDPNDLKYRCLCGDNIGPVNGRCEAKTKGLRHACIQSSECQETMVCSLPNITQASGGGYNKGSSGSGGSGSGGGTVSHYAQQVQLSPTTKICQCSEDDGYVDKEYYCSDGIVHTSVPFNIFLVALVCWLQKDIMFSRQLNN